MTRLSIVRAATALAATFLALGLAPSHGAAQQAGELRGLFIGLGGGVGNVRDQNINQNRTGLMLHARAGWGFGSNAVMLEGAWHGLGDEQARVDDVLIPDDPS